jgi:WD40 repeat protein
MDQDASFIADTHQIVVINQAGHMQFWDIDSKRLLAQSQLTEHQFSRINPTGSLIASSNPQERIDLWSIEPFLTTQILYPMTLIRSNYRVPDNLANLAYSPDGTQFVTHSWDGQVRLWDSANGRELQNFTSQDTINVLAFSPDGEGLAIGGSNYPSPAPGWMSFGLTDIWHGSQGTTITLTHEHDVNDIAFSPDGRFFATATNITQLWDVASGTKIITCAPDLMPLNLIFTPDGNQLIILTRDKVVICNLQTGEITQTLLPQENNEFWKMTLHPNGRILAVAENTTIDIWELDTNIVLTTLTASEVKYQSELIFSPDGRYLANFTKWTNPINDINPNLDIWDTQDWHPIINERMPQVNAFAFSPDGNYMALGDNNGLIRILSLPDGHEFSQLQYDESIKQIAFHPDGQQIAALGWETALLWQWNPIDWFSETCQRLSRNLTHAEWQEYFGNEPYQATCSNLSVP